MYEKRLKAVAPQLFLANGTTLGRINIATASLFKVKQKVTLYSTTQGMQNFEVKRVESATILYVGPVNNGQSQTKITDRSDISGFLVADGAWLSADEQPRPNIPEQEIERLTYEEEPVVARRVVLVDENGDKITDSNPLPVDANVTIGGINVDLDAFNSTPDSTLAVGSEDGTKTGARHVVRVASDGSVMARNFSSLVPEPKTKIDIVSRNINGDIAVARFYNGITTICDLNLSYDANGDLLSVERV